MVPRLSIITVNFNNVVGLRRTLESVAAQTSREFEHVVVDGGSTDGSVEVIREFAERITWWVSEADSGIYEAMNKGIRAATGEYCQFLNSGDWLAGPEVTANMLVALTSPHAVFYGNMLKHMPDGVSFRDKCEQGNITMRTFYKGSLNHSPAYIRRDLFQLYGCYDETLRIVSDWKWYLVAIGLHGESVGYINLDVSNFDMSGISNTNPVLEKTERRRVLEQLIPRSVLADYDTFGIAMDQIERVKRYRIVYFGFWFTERILFKFEKWKKRRSPWVQGV